MTLYFEWNETKNMVNILKHGVAFEEAGFVFHDPRHTEVYDMEHSTVHEDRWRACGLAGKNLLVVVFTEKNGIIRIISARKALRMEEEDYYYGYS
jgi:uncharacterized DUF497 family protein